MSQALHIKRPVNPRFIARVRISGHRKYRVIGRNFKSEKSAAKAMIKEFTSRFEYKRGDVLMVEDWYEPNQLLEVTR
jgi:hypothetical protein